MKSLVVKRSIAVDGHKTSISLEDLFWTDLKAIAHSQQMKVRELVTRIDGAREQGNLSSAIRLFVLHHFRLAQWPGHGLAGESRPAQSGGLVVNAPRLCPPAS